MKLKCSRCGSSDFTIYTEYELSVNDDMSSFNFNKTEITESKYIICCNCGRKIPFEKIPKKKLSKIVSIIGGDKDGRDSN